MPINNLSNTPRLPRLGKIRLGIRSPGARGDHPTQTPYFVCPPEVREIYGERPTELDIAFPTDDDAQWADPWYKLYSSVMGLLCRGDGVRAQRRVDMAQAVDANGALPLSDHPRYWPLASRESKQAALREIDCPPDCPQRQAKDCGPMLNLQYLLPKVGGLGVYQTDTRSWNSIRNVRDGVHLIKALTGGRIALLPLKLSLLPMEVQPETGPKHRVYVLQLTFGGTLQDLYRVAEMPPARAMLPNPDEDAAVEDSSRLSDSSRTERNREEIAEAEDSAHVVDADFDQVDDSEDERRASAWRGVQEAIRAGVTKAQVVRWLKDEAGFAVGQQLVGADSPPEGLPTEVIERLRDALGQAQMRLAT